MHLPIMPLPIQFSVFTNPVTVATGIAPGPAGYRTQFTRVVERAGNAISANAVKQAAIDLMVNGDPAERMRTADLLQTISQMIATTPKVPKEMLDVGVELKVALDRSASMH